MAMPLLTSAFIPLILCAPGPSDQTAATWGALHRIAAAHELTLNIYRLALSELVPALERVADEQQINADSALIFDDLAASIHHRVPRGALPGISAAYHAEVVSASAALSLAQFAEELPRPAAQLLRAMKALATQGRKVADLFSRARPFEARVLDSTDIFNELSQGLDEVAAAENDVRKLQRQRANSALLAGAFRRTELALGHVLDIWAMARELGIDFDDHKSVQAVFDTPVFGHETTSLLLILNELDRHLEELNTVVQRFNIPPRTPAPPTVTWVQDDLSDTKTGVDISWLMPVKTAPEDKGIARVELFRSEPKDGSRQRLGKWSSTNTMPSFTDTPVLPGQDHPLYSIEFVSAFGARSRSEPAPILVVYKSLQAVTEVQALDKTPSPFAPEFYENAGWIEISWARSPSDHTSRNIEQQLAVQHDCARANGYLIERRIGNTISRIAQIPAGVWRYADRPTPAQMKAGVSYRIGVVGENGRGILAPAGHQWTPVLSRALEEELQLAKSGAAALVRPSATERQYASNLLAPEALKRARLKFQTRKLGERAYVRGSFWRSLPFSQIKDALQRWPDLFVDVDLSEYADTDLPVATLHAGWLQAAYWLHEAEDGARLRKRWWSILSRSRKQEATDLWDAAMSAGHRHYLQRNPGYADKQLHTFAWWLGRDQPERDALQEWWFEQRAGDEQRKLRNFINDLPEATRRDLRWPPWTALSHEIQRAYLQSPPSPFPPELERRFYAWLKFEELPALKKATAVAKDVRWWSGVLAKLRYELRPIDIRLGFRLKLYFILSVFLFSLLAYGWRKHKRAPLP